MKAVTARANANIAFIKYWGNADETLRLPANPSLSMNLNGIFTETTVRWRGENTSDKLQINGAEAENAALARVSAHLDLIRERLGLSLYAQVESVNNFPMGAGIASSASAFAALTVAAVAAADAALSERELTTIARRGSGSASRSVPSGFVEWYTGDTNTESYAETIALPDHWALVDVIAVVSSAHKAVGSRAGHTTAQTSDLQEARVLGAGLRLANLKQALLARDFATFAEIVERDSNLMHAVMMTSRPPLFYWLPPTLAIMQAVRDWRDTDGLNVCYTLDAGPNVHCICTQDSADAVAERVRAMPGVQDVLRADPGGPATVVATAYD